MNKKNFTLNLYHGILDNLNNIDETLNSFLMIIKLQL